MSFQDHQKSKIREHWENKMKDISENRPLNRYWAHFDFDMFYVACELLDKYLFIDSGPNSRINPVLLEEKMQFYAQLTMQQDYKDFDQLCLPSSPKVYVLN